MKWLVIKAEHVEKLNLAVMYSISKLFQYKTKDFDIFFY